jgi:hypothetical protein
VAPAVDGISDGEYCNPSHDVLAGDVVRTLGVAKDQPLLGFARNDVAPAWCCDVRRHDGHNLKCREKRRMHAVAQQLQRLQQRGRRRRTVPVSNPL